MKIALVGPGIMPIPPDGWGAVEMLIWDYYQILTSWGHSVDIINTPDKNEIIDQVNTNNYDAVHVHYDHFYDIMPVLKAKAKIISSHYPYMHNPQQWANDDYSPKFSGICLNTDWWIFASSKEDVQLLQNCALYGNKVFHAKLGVNHKSYNFTTKPENDKTLCLGKITDRKYQWFLQKIDGIDFVGKYGPGSFDPHGPNYLGEMPRKQLNEIITKYTNLVLLSVAENATPLVVKEALVCGLGVVVSECCALELDPLPFITVIPNSQMNNIEYIKQAIEKNKDICKNIRADIREYGISKFSLETILKEYIGQIEKINAPKMQNI